MPESIKKSKHIVVIGGGPIGLEFAVHALKDGHKVTVLEKKEYAYNVQTWKFVRLFSPWKLNSTSVGLEVLTHYSVEHPDPAEFPTGDQFVEHYLSHLWRYIHEHERGEMLIGCEVLSVSRANTLKGEHIGLDSLRREHPFEVLVRHSHSRLDSIEEKASPPPTPPQSESPAPPLPPSTATAATPGAHDPIRGSLTSLDWDTTEEAYLENIDIVVDSSGTYGNANWLGEGGGPALGEKDLRSKGLIMNTIPDVLGEKRLAFAGKGRVTAIIGNGYSAITTISLLEDLAMEEGVTIDIKWITRNGPKPYEIIENDPLPNRSKLSQLGNKFSNKCSDKRSHAEPLPRKDSKSTIEVGPAGGGGRLDVDYLGYRSVRRVRERNDGRIEITLRSRLAKQGEEGEGEGEEAVANGRREGPAASTTSTTSALPSSSSSSPQRAVGAGSLERIVVDNLVAMVGYRPDASLYRELQVHQCWASEGPMKLAAALLSAEGATTADCLKQETPGPMTLRNPEPDFYILGMKSYGRSSKFLLRVGHEQINHVLSLIDGTAAPSSSSTASTAAVTAKVKAKAAATTSASKANEAGT